MSFKNSAVNNQYALFTGGRGGWLINDTYSIGAGFYGLTNRVNAKENPLLPDNPYFAEMNYGGLEFELIYPSGKFIHPSIILFFGGGGLKLRSYKQNGFSPYGLSLLVWEPQLNCEMNLLSWLHLNAGLSYRIVTGFDNYYGIEPQNLSSFSGVISFRFGEY